MEIKNAKPLATGDENYSNSDLTPGNTSVSDGKQGLKEVDQTRNAGRTECEEGVNGKFNEAKSKLYLDRAFFSVDEIAAMEPSFRRTLSSCKMRRSDKGALYLFALYVNDKLSTILSESNVTSDDFVEDRPSPDVFFKALRRAANCDFVQNAKKPQIDAVVNTLGSLRIGQEPQLADFIQPIFQLWPKFKEEIVIEVRLFATIPMKCVDKIYNSSLENLFDDEVEDVETVDADYSLYKGATRLPTVTLDDVKTSPQLMPIIGYVTSMLFKPRNGSNSNGRVDNGNQSSPFKF